MIDLVRKLLCLFDPPEKRRGLLVIIMITVMAALEVAGVASVMPFLSVLGNPDIVFSSNLLSTIYNRFEFTSVDNFLISLGFLAFVFILAASFFKALTQYALIRYVEVRRHNISNKLLDVYLRQPYAFFLNRHTSDMAKSVLSEVDLLTINVLRPGMETLAYTVVMIAILTLLVVTEPLLAIIVLLVLSGIYGLIYLILRGVLGRAGKDIVLANQERFFAAGEALGGIKDIKLLGHESTYLSRFLSASNRFARHQITNQTTSQIPNYVVEAVAFGGIILLTLVLLFTRGGINGGALGEILPLLGLYAFAGLRMKPAAHKIYTGFAKLRFGVAALESIYTDYQYRSSSIESIKQNVQPIKPERAITLQDIHFSYPDSGSETLSGIDLNIPIGNTIGLIGTTGAGKTTLVDVILGLLRPTRGIIRVDENPVTDTNLRNWQCALGYVPQDIFLVDATVNQNIALGVPLDQIDYAQVKRCARMAQVHDFIMSDMPEGYDTKVGERGVRLSGGQRQRIGIARALYHEPHILVFDEATSALDNITEKAVMESINALHNKKTIIIIAHRLSTIRECDHIYLLDKGRIIGSGTYDELKLNNEEFKNMEKAAR